MSEQRIIFMGTPVFACGILQRLIDEGSNVVGVVSQPDKKVGRRQELQPTPVKQLAESIGYRYCSRSGSKRIMSRYWH